MSTLGRVCLQVSGVKLKRGESVDTCTCFRGCELMRVFGWASPCLLFVCASACQPPPRLNTRTPRVALPLCGLFLNRIPPSPMAARLLSLTAGTER